MACPSASVASASPSTSEKSVAFCSTPFETSRNFMSLCAYFLSAFHEMLLAYGSRHLSHTSLSMSPSSFTTAIASTSSLVPLSLSMIFNHSGTIGSAAGRRQSPDAAAVLLDYGL